MRTVLAFVKASPQNPGIFLTRAGRQHPKSGKNYRKNKKIPCSGCSFGLYGLFALLLDFLQQRITALYI